MYRNAAVIASNTFQFHYGAIKGITIATGSAGANSFQFHYGAIKGVELAVILGVPQDFNSTMVRLKAKFITSDSLSKEISIPLWCD